MITQAMNRRIGPREVQALKHVPAAATACVITLAADPVRQHVLHHVHWSYGAAPAGGRLTVENGASNIVLDLDIIAGGPGGLSLHIPSSPNTALIITLASGGGVVQGKLAAQAVSTGAN